MWRARGGAVALEVTGLSMRAPSAFGTALKEISLSVRRGEILGIGGVAGSGQDELLAALAGETRVRRRDPAERGGHRPSWPECAAQAGAADRARATAGPCRGPGDEPDGKRPDDRRAARGAAVARLHPVGRGARFRAGDHHAVRRAHPRPGRGRAGAVGGQPAEIRDRARGAATPRCSGRQSAHMGRRCRRRRRDPAGAAGSGSGARRSSASARISTS